MRSTISQALQEMRALHDTDAGRLRGVSLRYRFGMTRHGLAATPQPWRDRVQAGIDARQDGCLTGDSPEYLVFSDRVLVAVLTAAAHVVLPGYPLTALQTRHQQAAALALADLHRYALADLADRAATPDDAGQTDEPWQAPPGWLRLAAATDPTLTAWVEIGAGLPAARAALSRACHAEPDRVLIIEASGFGAYGRNRHRHRLDVLCAMRQIASAHRVSLQVVGDWLDAEAATTRDDVTPAAVVAEFAAAYVGPYTSQADYARARMSQLGWTQALHAAGVPEEYLDTAAITRDWFTSQVRGIRADPVTASTSSPATRTPQPPGRRRNAVNTPEPPPAPTGHTNPVATIRRVLTVGDLRAIHAAAETSTSPAQLLRATLAALDTALTRPDGTAPELSRPRRTQPDVVPTGPGRIGRTLPDPLRSVRDGYAIPTRQWDTIFDLITDRAHAWGVAAEIGLDLALNLMPAHYDDPEPAPPHAADPQTGRPEAGHSGDLALPGLRRGEHRITLTADAVATIAACQAHLRRLRDHHSATSTVYQRAADS
jgi:hypothetical protein